jgi:hypothetical protein
MQSESQAGSGTIYANFFVSGLSIRNSGFYFIPKDAADNVLDSRAVHYLYYRDLRTAQIMVGDVVVDIVHSDSNLSVGVRIQVLASPKACTVCPRPQPLPGARSGTEVSAMGAGGECDGPGGAACP